MKYNASATMLLVLALLTARPCDAHDQAHKTIETSVLEMGSIQLDAATLRRLVVAGQWKPATKQLASIERSLVDIEASPDITTSQHPALNALKNDLVLLKAAVTANDAERVVSLTEVIGTDVTNIAASDQRI